jgi:acyl-CoA reductase-like NAD-dependent aldehyde dehydrogenase
VVCCARGAPRSPGEEIFGPCCHVARVDTETEAVAPANDIEYGLATTIWTPNLARGSRCGESRRREQPDH